MAHVWLPGGGVSGVLPALVSTSAVLAAGSVVLLTHTLGLQSAHMAAHIAAMSVAAPLAAAAWVAKLPAFVERRSFLWGATGAQLVLFWGWHAPGVQQTAMASHAVQSAMHATLLVAAIGFWCAVVRVPAAARWHAIAALAVTGKLTCLLSALLIFSPRALYATHDTQLDDQQLAGLLMICACPLSYLVAALVIAVQTIRVLTSDRVVSPAG
jgi:putative membrane protein